MNWYIIFENDRRINNLLLSFNDQPEINAFVPKVEKLMSKDGKKWFLEVPMFPNCLFVETRLSEEDFNNKVKEVFKDFYKNQETLYDKNKKVFALPNNEKNLLESLLNEDYSIIHSTGIIINSKLIVQKGPLIGKEKLIRKIDRHKRLAFLNDISGKLMKVPLEVINKS